MPEVVEVCLRWALGKYEVAEVYLRWPRHALMRYEVTRCALDDYKVTEVYTS
jgi:hypothetical protein